MFRAAQRQAWGDSNGRTTVTKAKTLMIIGLALAGSWAATVAPAAARPMMMHHKHMMMHKKMMMHHHMKMMHHHRMMHRM